MAVSSLATGFTYSSWNPLKNNSTGLPPNVLVVAKSFSLFLIIKSLFFTGGFFRLHEPYLPFLSIFDQIDNPILIHRILQVGLYTSAVAILFNRSVRTFCLIAGSCILLSMLGAKGGFTNNFLFTSFILLLVGLQRTGENKSSWIRYQLAVLYLGAALNKGMDPDWQSGRFMEFWMNDLPIPTFQKLAALFPPMVFSKFLSWFTIATESILAVLALSNRFTSLFIFIGICFHFGITAVTGRTFGWFFPMLVVSYVSIMKWPSGPIQVYYDADRKFCERMKTFMKRVDADHFFNWTPSNSGLQVIVDGKILNGFNGFRALIIYNPLTYLFFILLVACLSPIGSFTAPTKILIGSMLLFISPLFTPAGEAIYSVLSRRKRSRFST